MKNTCETCKNFAVQSEHQAFGLCNHDKFVYGGPYENDNPDEVWLYYEDFENYAATLFVSKNFGCIGWDGRP